METKNITWVRWEHLRPFSVKRSLPPTPGRKVKMTNWHVVSDKFPDLTVCAREIVPQYREECSTLPDGAKRCRSCSVAVGKKARS